MKKVARFAACLVWTGCASNAPPAPPPSPAFDAAVECVIATMRSGMYLETQRRWVFANSGQRGGRLERDPSHPELLRDHLELRFASSTDPSSALIRVFGTAPAEPVEVNVGPVTHNTKVDQLRRQVSRECNPASAGSSSL